MYKSKIEQGLKLAASQPLDADFQLCINSEPIYKLYASSFSLFHHGIFQMAQFEELIHEMRSIQDDLHNN